jgi:hypothetical protein
VTGRELSRRQCHRDLRRAAAVGVESFDDVEEAHA